VEKETKEPRKRKESQASKSQKGSHRERTGRGRNYDSIAMEEKEGEQTCCK
jgi:hypothetical protein